MQLTDLKSILAHYQLVDLTHRLNSNVPTWNGVCGFTSHEVLNYDQGCRVHHLEMFAGIGTHMDAPIHFIPNAMAIADIPLVDLIVPACVIDVSKKAHADYLVTPEDILEYEKNYGKITKNSLVIAYTGWDKFWQDPVRFRNADANNMARFPAYAKSTAELLIEREVAGIGIDTLSPDQMGSAFPVHHIILGNGKYIVECVANAGKLPAKDAYVFVMPLRIEGGTESPVRLIALVPK